MHEGLNHQDVVALEQEYSDKMTQVNERARKTSKVDPDQFPSNNVVIPAVNETSPSNNVNEEPTNNDVPATNEDRFVGMHPAALDRMIKKQTDPYPHYRVFRKGTKYEYSTVQYERFGAEFIAEPFVDGIRTRDGTHEYHVYFVKEMTVTEYRKQRKEHEDALVESTRSKPRTFLWFYKKWKRHQEYNPDMRKYQRELYGKFPPWMTFEQIVIRNAVNREYGFLNI